MDILKFRVWDKTRKCMYPVEGIDFVVNPPRIHITQDDMHVTYQIGEGDRLEIMQYTGLSDKSGKPIFADDIIKADWHWDNPHKITWPHDYYALLEYSLEGDNLEVIGNCWDKPELLPKEINPLDVFEGGEV